MGSERTTRYCSYVAGLAIVHPEWGDREAELESSDGILDGCVLPLLGATILNANRIRISKTSLLQHGARYPSPNGCVWITGYELNMEPISGKEWVGRISSS